MLTGSYLYRYRIEIAILIIGPSLDGTLSVLFGV